MLALQEANAAARLQADVAQLDPTDQRLLAPVLRSPALQQLLIAMNSDGDGANSAGGSPDERAQPDGVRGPSSQLQAWVANPRVLQLLREAARALAKGALTEERLCQLLRQQVQVLLPQAALALSLASHASGAEACTRLFSPDG